MIFEEMIKLPYLKMLEVLLEKSPKNCVWTSVSNWLQLEYSQKQISQVYLILLYEFKRRKNAPQELLEMLDLFYYSGDKILIDQEVKKIKINNKEI